MLGKSVASGIQVTATEFEPVRKPEINGLAKLGKLSSLHANG